jgi:positive regulator of sigma E activity
MLTQMNFLTEAASLIAGTILGLAFGYIQETAWRRYQRQQREGNFHNGWAVMPGSMSRVAYFLVAMVLVQIVCPMLFKDGCQWWVSGGVVLGYGVMLYRQLRERIAQNR